MKYGKFFSLIIFIIMSSIANADASTMLVMDMHNASVLPKHFRTAHDALSPGFNNIGLKDLHIAGGAQFSNLSLQTILQTLKTQHLIIIDLREESHGFLNGNAISWYGFKNAENSGKNADEIARVQSRLLTHLGKETTVNVNKIVTKTQTGKIDQVHAQEYAVHQVITEEDLVTNQGHTYQRIFVQDYNPPKDEQVDRFVELVKQIPKQQWIYLHCRAGVGRTTVFMTMYDMMHNAKQVSLADILARQTALGGKNLFKLPPPTHFKYQWAVERLNFISKFYQYARENDDNFKTSWSEWLLNHELGGSG